MKESLIQRLEHILQVNAPRENKGSWGYTPQLKIFLVLKVLIFY